jgi:hypothetical protein
MGFRNNSFAKVWGEVKISSSGKYAEARISVSRKDKNSGEYKQEFGGYVRFIGDALEKAKTLKEGDSIKLLSVDVQNNYNKETKKEYTNYLVFDFELQSNNSGGGSSKPAPSSAADSIPDIPDDEELPWE